MRIEMIVLNLEQQLQALQKDYPNYGRSIEMLSLTIESFQNVERPKGVG
jgi:hypothetical protein